MMTILDQLASLGQSIWLDYIDRSILENGELQQLVEAGLRGMTSNPTIFEKAIAQGGRYDQAIKHLLGTGLSAEEITVRLTVEDVRQAAELLEPVFQATQRQDGYISLEVNPKLAYDADKTLAEARRLWALVGKPNLMIKIPATQQAMPAISAAIAAGINVNVTLIFSLQRYDQVMQAYLQGLRERVQKGQPIDQIASVASFFVSRIDSKVDSILEQLAAQPENSELASSLLGKTAIANAKLAYQHYKQVFEGPEFAPLKDNGAQVQRPLWASTSTKNPAYADILYVQELIGPHTVNTLPKETLSALLDHGQARLTLEDGLDQAEQVFLSLQESGVDIGVVTQVLESEGIQAFEKSYTQLENSIQAKCEQFIAQMQFSAYLGKYQPVVSDTLTKIEHERIPARLWAMDYTVWKNDPAEITNRLGWLRIANALSSDVPVLEAFSRTVRAEGFTDAVLLGMGGSSLAPELFSLTFGGKPGYLHLQVLDSTHPGAVAELAGRLALDTTLFIVSTKSGGTEETLSFFKYFYNRVSEQIGPVRAGSRFIAITDPGSKLIQIAEQHHFRKIFLNDPNIGGRYSALSHFGLVPAALCGVDLQRLLDSALVMARACGQDVPPEQSPGAQLGAALGILAKSGINKTTLVLPPELSSFGDWVEQLIAESTGKEGVGILPVVREPLTDADRYSPDRLFVIMHLAEHETQLPLFAQLAAAGHPRIHIHLHDLYDLGAQFFLWEFATALAGHVLRINPFDQPNVEAAKHAARQMTAAYIQSGQFPQQSAALVEGQIEIFSASSGNSLADILDEFIGQARPRDYIALQAFIQPGPQVSLALQELRLRLLERCKLATTSGYGPRFLHSTGQLHKGDSGQGLFIQFTEDIEQDLPIPLEAGAPESAMSFGTLILAQALGDLQALGEAGRRVIRIHFKKDSVDGLRLLAKLIQG